MIWLILIVLYGPEATPWNSHQSSPDPGLVRVRPNKGHCFAYDAVRSEQQGATLHYPFSWDEVDGTGATTFSWELRGEQGIYQPVETIKPILERHAGSCSPLSSRLKVVARQYHPPHPR